MCEQSVYQDFSRQKSEEVGKDRREEKANLMLPLAMSNPFCRLGSPAGSSFFLSANTRRIS
jgi:hypothetical protein